MSRFFTPAIMLRRVEYGDHDLILTFLTKADGKISAIAKHAKKSVKRFAGVLELFSCLQIVCDASSNRGKQRGLPILKEASILDPFSEIRADVVKTAYASYWAELINGWMEADVKNNAIYTLFSGALSAIARRDNAERETSAIFQMKFLAESGLTPNLSQCVLCRVGIDNMNAKEIGFNLEKGGLVCPVCAGTTATRLRLSKGTIKQLLWISEKTMAQAQRTRFSPTILEESTRLLEAFVPFHMGKEPKSLGFLRQIRRMEHPPKGTP